MYSLFYLRFIPICSSLLFLLYSLDFTFQSFFYLAAVNGGLSVVTPVSAILYLSYSDSVNLLLLDVADELMRGAMYSFMVSSAIGILLLALHSQ